MAQIDASIPLGIRQVQIESPVNQLAKVLQVRGLQQEGEMNRLKMDEYQRGITEQNALSGLYQSAMKPDGTFDRNALFTGAAQRGLGHKIPGLQKQFMEQDTAATKVDAEKFKLAKERHDYFKSTLGALAQEPNVTKEMVIQAGQTLVQQGILPAEMFQQSMANMPDDPQQLRMRLIQGVKAQMTPEQMFTVFAPKPEKVDNGQQIRFRDTNPNSPTYGQATAGGVVQKVADPGAVLSAETARRGQNMTDARAREGNNIQREAARTQVVETPEGVMLIDKGTGQARPATSGGRPLAGKPSAATEKELVGIRQQNAIIDGAIRAVDATPKAFSLGRGMATMAGAVPESLAGRMDSDAERQARSYVFNNVSKVINERAGAAQSAQELARLRSFLPAETDNAAQIKSKLQAFKTYLGDMEQGTRGKSAPSGGATGDWGNDPLGLRK